MLQQRGTYYWGQHVYLSICMQNKSTSTHYELQGGICAMPLNVYRETGGGGEGGVQPRMAAAETVPCALSDQFPNFFEGN